MNLVGFGSILLQIGEPSGPTGGNGFVDGIMAIAKFVAFVAVLLVVLGGLIYVLWPRINPYLRRFGSGRSYKTNAAQGHLTAPVRIRRNGAHELDTRRFDKLQERLFGKVNESFPMVLHKSVGVLGAPGAGKTEFIKTLIYQVRKHPSDIPMVVFDTKGEFEKFFRSSIFADTEVVKLGIDGSTYRYNLLGEASEPQDFREIVKLMFREPGEGSSDHDFFSSTAIHLLESMMRCYLELDIPSVEQDETTEGFLRFINQFDVGEMREIIASHPASNVSKAAEFIDPESERQQQGVYSSVIDNVKSVFVGNFAGRKSVADESQFSMRQFFSDFTDGVLLISQPPDAADSTDLMYRFLLDWAMKLSLSDEYPHWFVYDEFSALPALDYIDNLVERGRAQNSAGVFGLQDISQVKTAYGSNRGKQLMASMTQQVLMSVNSDESAEFIEDQMGTQIVERSGTKTTVDGETVEGTFEFQEPIVKASEARDWGAGECAITVKRQDGRHWAVGKLAVLPSVWNRYDKAASQFPEIEAAGGRVPSPLIWSGDGVETLRATEGSSVEELQSGNRRRDSAAEIEATGGKADDGAPDSEFVQPETVEESGGGGGDPPQSEDSNDNRSSEPKIQDTADIAEAIDEWDYSTVMSVASGLTKEFAEQKGKVGVLKECLSELAADARSQGVTHKDGSVIDSSDLLAADETAEPAPLDADVDSLVASSDVLEDDNAPQKDAEADGGSPSQMDLDLDLDDLDAEADADGDDDDETTDWDMSLP